MKPEQQTPAPDVGMNDLKFEAGYPTRETTRRVFDEFDYQAAVQTYVWSTPILGSMGAWKPLQRDAGRAPGELAMAVSGW